jgi:hypothetical protein
MCGLEAYLVIDLVNGLLALAVHVQDLQERLVYALVVSETRLATKQNHAQESSVSDWYAVGAGFVCPLHSTRVCGGVRVGCPIDALTLILFT